MLLLSVIYYRLFTMFGVVLPEYTIRCRPLYILDEQHTRSKAALFRRIPQTFFHIVYRGPKFFFLIDRIIFDFIFLSFLLQRVINAFRRPCNLNASIGKATDSNFSDRYIYLGCSCEAVCKKLIISFRPSHTANVRCRFTKKDLYSEMLLTVKRSAIGVVGIPVMKEKCDGHCFLRVVFIFINKIDIK